jgi:hypothetical protein
MPRTAILVYKKGTHTDPTSAVTRQYDAPVWLAVLNLGQSRLARSVSKSRKRVAIGPFRIRFSASSYSFRSRSCWSTVPVMYARMRAHSTRSPSAANPQPALLDL